MLFIKSFSSCLINSNLQASCSNNPRNPKPSGSQKKMKKSASISKLQVIRGQQPSVCFLVQKFWRVFTIFFFSSLSDILRVLFCFALGFGFVLFLLFFFPLSSAELYQNLLGKMKCSQQEALNQVLLYSDNCSLHASLRAESYSGTCTSFMNDQQNSKESLTVV